MSDNEHPQRRVTDISPPYYLGDDGTYDAQMLANILKYEFNAMKEDLAEFKQTTKEDMAEFKTDTKSRISRLEGWLASILFIAVSSLVTIMATIITKLG
jgi:hypothetical protein